MFSLSLQVREIVLGQGELVIRLLFSLDLCLPQPRCVVLAVSPLLPLALGSLQAVSFTGCFEGILHGMNSARSLQSSAWEAMERASGLPSEGFGYRILGVSQAGLELAEMLT